MNAAFGFGIDVASFKTLFMATPLTNNQLDPRERTSQEPFNQAETQDASMEEMDTEDIDQEDQQLTEDEMAADDDDIE